MKQVKAAVASSTEDRRNLSATPGAERGRLKPTDGAASPRRCTFLLPESGAASGLGSEQEGEAAVGSRSFARSRTRKAQLGHAPKAGFLRSPSCPLRDSTGCHSSQCHGIRGRRRHLPIWAPCWAQGHCRACDDGARGPGLGVRRAGAGGGGRSSGAARGARRVRRRGLARGRAGRRSEGKLIADLSGGCGSEQDTMYGPGTRPTAAER